MVKKHVKPARKSPAASRGKSTAKKRPAKKPAAKKPAASASRRGSSKRPAGNASRKATASRKPAPATAAKGAAPAAKPKAAPKSKLLVKAGSKPAPTPKLDKQPAKPLAAAPTPLAKGVPGHKPSAGEIAAKIAGKRAEDAAHKKGKNGKHADVAPRELTPADVEARKRRLKTLIVLGKERGYLTYAEINDHLPDDILDAEQIEGIISMIGDMGIQVYDEAPDAETLLMSETTPTVPAEDVE